jgi:hypothetical protein
MVYNTQNDWVFGLCPLSSILATRKHNVSETPSVYVLRCGGWETPTVLGPLERGPVIEVSSFKRPNRVDVPPPPPPLTHLRTETDQVS